MILKIYDENAINDPNEDQVFLTLQEKDHDGNRHIYLRAVDKKENIISSILFIVNGIIVISENLDDKIPIKTDLTCSPLVYSCQEIEKFKERIHKKLFAQHLHEHVHEKEKSESTIN